MPDYSLNWTARSSYIERWQRCQWCNSTTWRSQVCLCWTVPASVKPNSKLMPSALTLEWGVNSVGDVNKLIYRITRMISASLEPLTFRLITARDSRKLKRSLMTNSTCPLRVAVSRYHMLKENPTFLATLSTLRRWSSF